MKIISLSSNIAGPACAVSYCIKNYYNNNYFTNFFDYLEVSLLSIIQVLKSNNIEHDLKENIEIYVNKDNKNSVSFNNFNRMISHHDLPINYNEHDYYNFINKYERRYYRLIEYIKKEDKIFFIRYGLENYDYIVNFISEVNNINKNVEVFFINVDFNESKQEVNYNIKNYYYINFYNFFDYNITYHSDLYYKTIQFNWKEVFNVINKLLV